MKTTLVFPDDLMLEIKIESVRRHQTLKSLVAELIRAGLIAQRKQNEISPRESSEKHRRAAERWISSWKTVGKQIEKKSTKKISSVVLLEADRGSRG